MHCKAGLPRCKLAPCSCDKLLGGGAQEVTVVLAREDLVRPALACQRDQAGHVRSAVQQLWLCLASDRPRHQTTPRLKTHIDSVL